MLSLAGALVAVVVLALGASSAVAADEPSLADAVAQKLGISTEQLRAAFKATLAARVDAALAAGKLTPDQAAKLKERIANAEGLGLGARRSFTERQHALAKRIGAKVESLGAAAAYLGLTREELRARLKGGKSLAQVASAQGKTVDGLVAAILAPAKQRLAKAVEAKRLTRQRADELLDRLGERVEKRVAKVPTAQG